MSTLPIVNPATGEVLGEVAEASPEQVLATVAAARQAFATWGQTTVRQRIEYITRFRLYLVENLEYIVEQICLDSGKVRLDALVAEVLSTVDIIKYYEKNAPRLLRDRRASTPLTLWGKQSYISYRPLGVVAVISPWNYPFNLAVVPIVSALLAGNTVILKPSEVTPLVGRLVEEVFQRLELPPGVFSVLHGGPAVGKLLVEAAPDKIFFTGSVATGKHIMAAAAQNLTPVELELGGKDPMIVFADANLDRAVNGALWGALTNCGQVCMSVERIYVQDTVYDVFLNKLVEGVRAVVQGTGPNCDLGCITYHHQRDIIHDHLDDAVAKGARILIGGSPADRKTMFVPPTVLVNVDHSMRIMQEETFGPIVPVMPFSTESEAIRLANDSPYGLNASVWTRDLKKARRVVKALVTGNAVINDVIITFANPALPFGGAKNSGIGRYHGPEGLYTFCHVTSVMVDRGKKRKEVQWYPYTATRYQAFKHLVQAMYGKRFKPLLATRAGLRLLKNN